MITGKISLLPLPLLCRPPEELDSYHLKAPCDLIVSIASFGEVKKRAALFLHAGAATLSILLPASAVTLATLRLIECEY